MTPLLFTAFSGDVERETLICPEYPGVECVEIVQSCIKRGLDRTSGRFLHPEHWNKLHSELGSA